MIKIQDIEEMRTGTIDNKMYFYAEQLRVVLEVELRNGDTEYVEEHCRVDKLFRGTGQ